MDSHVVKKPQKLHNRDAWTRTRGLLHIRQSLYHLRYIPLTGLCTR